jgi:hypothetical protein
MTEIRPQKEFPLLERYKKVFKINRNTIFAYDNKLSLKFYVYIYNVSLLYAYI